MSTSKKSCTLGEKHTKNKKRKKPKQKEKQKQKTRGETKCHRIFRQKKKKQQKKKKKKASYKGGFHWYSGGARTCYLYSGMEPLQYARKSIPG